jgi:hypothetical protein
MLSESKYFYTLTHLPVDTDGDWVRAASLIDAFKSSDQNVFCFMINKAGNALWIPGIRDRRGDLVHCVALQVAAIADLQSNNDWSHSV